MTLPILAKKVKRLAALQFLNIKLLINGKSLSKFKKEYYLGDEMGQGGFGVVYRAIRLSDGLPVAVKFIEWRHVREWGRLNDERLPMEICMLARCTKVAGVVRLIDWFIVPEGFFIVMERPNACIDLFDFIHSHGGLSEDLTRFIFRQVVKTVMDCMRRKVLHRDIKDENIVIDLVNGETRLVDFGAATLLKKNHYQDFQGTRLYCPPEWFLHSIYMGTEAAVWSLGVLLYNMLNGKLPFYNEKDICTAHLLGPLPFFAKLTPEVRRLIEKCLSFDPYLRPSLESIFADEWLNLPTADWPQLCVSTNSCKNTKATSRTFDSTTEKKQKILQEEKLKASAGNVDCLEFLRQNNPISTCDEIENKADRIESGLDSCASIELLESETCKAFKKISRSLSQQNECNKAAEKPLSAALHLMGRKEVRRRNAKTSILSIASSDIITAVEIEKNQKNDLNSKRKRYIDDIPLKIHFLREKSEMMQSFDSGVSSTLSSPQIFCP